ncbi:MAG: S-layer homology domain-containing protein [Chloroflexota bacterium]
MNSIFGQNKKALQTRLSRWASLTMSGLIIWAIVASGSGGTGAVASGSTSSGASPLVPAVVCPGGQCFEDVDPANTFYAFINALAAADIIGGYPCGSPGEPCVAPNNRPYYRPGNTVTRAQMSKFVDNGRRNIADAVGLSLHMTSTQISLVISSTASDSIDASNASGAEAIQALCTRAGQNCWAFYSSAGAGNFAANMSGGRGVNVSSSDTGYAGLDANASSTGAGSYAVNASAAYRAGYFKSSNNGLYSLYVDTQDGPSQSTAGLEVNGSMRAEGNLYVAGSKAGYVADIMQNVSDEALEVGDVVTIVGSSAPVLGQIPAVTVRKANAAYDTGVVGVVDQVMYVPDAATKAAYDRQQAELRASMDARDKAMADYKGEGAKPDPAAVDMPEATITDAQGVLHADTSATQVQTGGYATVVTLGSYKGVKVDASFGPIHAGDLLVASTHAGYAMKATDRSLTSGATIGKALADFETGTGVIPVMVTLK